MPDRQVSTPPASSLCTCQTRMLSAPDVARRLRVDLHKVHRWIESGRLVAKNINDVGERKCWRIHPADLERFWASLPAGKAAPRPQTRPAVPRFFK